MKKLINRKSIIIASVAVLIAISTIVSINVFNSVGPVTGLLNTVSKPLRALASKITGTFESIYASIYKHDELLANYEAALMRIADLQEAHRESIIIAEENAQLRAALGFAERHRGYDHTGAIVIGRNSSNWSSSFEIDRGYSNSDIQRGNAVVTEFGMLIGQVSEVSALSSIVVTVLDTTFSAGAFIGDGDGRATVKGDFTLMRSGLLMLDHFDADLIIRPGDSVVTSGYGGVFPVGLVVGEVGEVFRHSTGIGRYATVKPMRDIFTISYVFVITGFEGADQENSEGQ